MSLLEVEGLQVRLRGADGPLPIVHGVDYQVASGEVFGSVRADEAGRYCMPLPPVGRYIVTMLEPTTLQAHARKLVLDVRSEVVDIDAPAAVVAKPAGR
jgi:ABC-type microcin C transport system duplicated ATPase subunit YejF